MYTKIYKAHTINAISKLTGSLLFFMMCFFLMGCEKQQKLEGTSNVKEINVEMFYFSACESCSENVKFEAAIRDKLSESEHETVVKYKYYNTFKNKDKAYMTKRMKELNHDIADADLPVALIDDKIYYGSYDEIGLQIMEDVVAESDIRSIVEQADSTDTILFLFVTRSCESCDKVKEYINNSVEDEYHILQGQNEVVSKIKIVECNILNPEHFELLNQLIKYYDVSEEDQRVPILFYKEGYLSGEANIKEKLIPTINNGSGMGYELKSFEEMNDSVDLKWRDSWKIMMTGFLNGLNPCAASMLMMVLSILLMTKRKFLMGSLTYMAGKVIAYMGMGLGAFWIFTVMKENYFNNLEQAITICFAVLALLLSFFNLMDFWNTKKKNYGKVIVQLPKRLRHFNHTIIRKLDKVPAFYILPVLFLLGLIISAGEFFCTGQLYIASILYLSKENHRVTAEVFSMLLVYVIAMCIPQIILILVIQKSRNLLGASRTTLMGMPVVKLLNGIVFFALGILLLFF